jgi:hypothetical protein
MTSARSLPARIGLAQLGLARWPYIVVTAVFVVSRIVYRYGFDIQFDTSPFSYFIQYVDPWFLQHDFWRTLLYLPHQAPLQNMIVGGIHRVFGEETGFAILSWLYTGLGLTLALSILHVMRRLGIKSLVAVIAVCCLTASPVSIIYENWLFYHTPLAALLVVALIPLLRHYRLGTWKSGAVFFGALATVALIRNIYGTVWMLAILSLLLLRPPLTSSLNPRPRLRLLKVAAIPIFLIALNGWKTSLLIGRGFGDSILWTNLLGKTWQNIPKKERERLHKEHVVSDAVKHEAFSPLSVLKTMRIPHEPTGVALLDMETSPNGRANLHTLEYLMIVDKYYKPDGKYVLRRYPRAYLAGVESALNDWYLSSPTRDVTLIRTPNYRALRPIEAPLERIMGLRGYGRLTALAYAFPFAFAYGAYRILRSRASLPSERSVQAALIFTVLTVAYVTLVTTLISYGDFSRYRYEIDALYLILFVLGVSHAASAVWTVATRATRWITQRARAMRTARPSSIET